MTKDEDVNRHISRWSLRDEMWHCEEPDGGSPMIRRGVLRISVSVFVIISIASCGNPDSEQEELPLHYGEVDDTTKIASMPMTGEVRYNHAAHIFISVDHTTDSSLTNSDSEALNLIRSIRSSIESCESSFQEMAAQHSDCSSSITGGILPDFTRGVFTQPLDSAFTELEPGEVSDVIRTRFGYHLLKRQDN